MKPVYAELTLPETDLALARSAHAAGKLDVEVSPMLVSGNSGVAAGAITFIDNAVDGTSATFKLRALLENSDETFWPGQSLNVLVDAGTVDKLVLVPLVAVQSRDSGAICYVVRPDRTIEIRRVDVALRVGDEAGIVHGLDAGELVVTEGQSSLVEGSRVVLEKTKPKSRLPLQTGEQNDQ
jgi:multidrug efflux system membrane fusion protein